MIELRNVHKKFGSRVAVSDLTLSVPRGEVFGLLGHNGAGKSTAIGMMLGQVWPTSGEVRLCGHDVTAHRARALHKVGAIFEAPAFYDYLSGWRNLEILSHYTAPTSKERIREVVDWVGLTGREMSKVKTYSHGMRARLALAQALLPQPELLILDEPGSGLDPEGIAEMRETIVRLHRELGLTILLSSHLLSEVEQLCTRIAVLNKGRKVFEGLIADVKAARGRVMLKTPDFAAATKLLNERGLICGTVDGKYISLKDGRTTTEVVSALVNAGVAVEGIWQQDQTLEDFYLSIVKKPPPVPGSN
ncbi:MAG TPA: ABC transporter ATP-binding protein [Verrucomicrobiae bacterium]|nr:ABC transporter ATP-binding protein [Verrucomicrobiae bacterium]